MKASEYFLRSQALLFGTFVLCAFLLPEGISTNEGVSYYSGHLFTLLPYSAGLLATAWYGYKTALAAPALRNWFIVLAGLLALTVLAPYGTNKTLRMLHTVISGVLFIVQLSFAVWQTRRQRNTRNLSLLTGLLVAFIIILTYLSPKVGYLIFGEIAFQAIFAVLTYHTVRRYDTVEHPYDYRAHKAQSAKKTA